MLKHDFFNIKCKILNLYMHIYFFRK